MVVASVEVAILSGYLAPTSSVNIGISILALISIFGTHTADLPLIGALIIVFVLFIGVETAAICSFVTAVSLVDEKWETFNHPKR